MRFFIVVALMCLLTSVSAQDAAEAKPNLVVYQLSCQATEYVIELEITANVKFDGGPESDCLPVVVLDIDYHGAAAPGERHYLRFIQEPSETNPPVSGRYKHWVFYGELNEASNYRVELRDDFQVDTHNEHDEKEDFIDIRSYPESLMREARPAFVSTKGSLELQYMLALMINSHVDKYLEMNVRSAQQAFETDCQNSFALAIDKVMKKSVKSCLAVTEDRVELRRYK